MWQLGVSGSEALSRSSSSSMSLADSMVAGVSGAVRRSPSDMQLSLDLKAGFADAADLPEAASPGETHKLLCLCTTSWCAYICTCSRARFTPHLL